LTGEIPQNTPFQISAIRKVHLPHLINHLNTSRVSATRWKLMFAALLKQSQQLFEIAYSKVPEKHYDIIVSTFYYHSMMLNWTYSWRSTDNM